MTTSQEGGTIQRLDEGINSKPTNSIAVDVPVREGLVLQQREGQPPVFQHSTVWSEMLLCILLWFKFQFFDRWACSPQRASHPRHTLATDSRTTEVKALKRRPAGPQGPRT